MQAWELARRLKQKNHDLYVFTRQLEGTEKYERKEGIDIFRTLPLRKPFGIISYLLGLFLIIFKQRKNLDVLLCFRGWPNGVIGWMANKILNIPACVTIRGGDWYFVERYWWGKLIYALLFSSQMPVAVQSKKIQKEVVAQYPRVTPHIIPNGIKQSTQQDKPGQSIVFVGNLIPRKGLDVLIKAIKTKPDYTLIIIGDGPERERLEKMAAGLPNITFYGRVNPEDVRSIMKKRARLLVLPAIEGEGFPNVLLEAMSVGVPVVASNIAGVADLLENGKAGLLVERGNVEELRDAICSIMNDDELQRKMAAAGFHASQQYTWDKVSRQWLYLFEEMIKKKSLPIE